MTRPAFDETLSDLADITATVNRTVAQASAENPSIVTLTIESGLLQQILTAASLHMSDFPFVPKPEVGEYADIIAENNVEAQDWHWRMRDAIEIVGARASQAAHPDSGRGRQRELGLATDRKHRALFAKMDAEQREKAEQTEPNTAEGLKARWEALNVSPLGDASFVDLMATLLQNTSPLSHETACRLFEKVRREASRANKAEKRVVAAVTALQGI